MGIQDRDHHREHLRHVTSLRRQTGPTTLQVAIFWIIVGGLSFAAATGWWLPRADEQRASQAERVPAAVAASDSPGPAPVPPPRPTYGAVPRIPASATPAAPIYRCGDRYGNDACRGGRTVDAPAAIGFDSRPSEKLARLVADGRVSGGETVPTVTATTSFEASGRTAECEGLAQEIGTIDRAARQPLQAYEQDRLRTERRRARDRQAALHC